MSLLYITDKNPLFLFLTETVAASFIQISQLTLAQTRFSLSFFHFTFLFQDQSIEKNIEPRESILLPNIKPGERFIRSARGASVLFKDSLLLKDSIGNNIKLDPGQDQISAYASQMNFNTAESDVRIYNG